MMSAMFGLSPNQLVGLLPNNNNNNQLDQQHNQQNQQQQQQQLQQQQQQPNIDLSAEIKRLQQLHQMSMSSAGAQPNALLMTHQQQQNQQQQQAALLQSMFGNTSDKQVINNNNNNNSTSLLFDQGNNNNNSHSGVASASFNPVFQPGLLQDARLLMAQNPFGGGGMNPMMMQAAGAILQQQGLTGGGALEQPLPSPHSLFHRDGTRRMRGGVIEPFPEKLHRLLTECELAQRQDVISWVAAGRAFCIHKPDKFFKEVVPLYFRQSRLSSFKRQLNLYGFELINSGPSRGGYFHELFVKDRPEACRRMRRVAVKVSSSALKQAAEEQKADAEAAAAAVAGGGAVDGKMPEISSANLAAADGGAFLPGVGGIDGLSNLDHYIQHQHQQSNNSNSD